MGRPTHTFAAQYPTCTHEVLHATRKTACCRPVAVGYLGRTCDRAGRHQGDDHPRRVRRAPPVRRHPGAALLRRRMGPGAGSPLAGGDAPPGLDRDARGVVRPRVALQRCPGPHPARAGQPPRQPVRRGQPRREGHLRVVRRRHEWLDREGDGDGPVAVRVCRVRRGPSPVDRGRLAGRLHAAGKPLRLVRVRRARQRHGLRRPRRTPGTAGGRQGLRRHPLARGPERGHHRSGREAPRPPVRRSAGRGAPLRRRHQGRAPGPRARGGGGEGPLRDRTPQDPHVERHRPRPADVGGREGAAPGRSADGLRRAPDQP